MSSMLTTGPDEGAETVVVAVMGAVDATMVGASTVSPEEAGASTSSSYW